MISCLALSREGRPGAYRWIVLTGVLMLALLFSLAWAAGSPGAARAQEEVAAGDESAAAGPDMDEEDAAAVADAPATAGDDPTADESADEDVDAAGEGEGLADEEALSESDLDDEPLQIVEEDPEPLISGPEEPESAGNSPLLWIVLAVVLVGALLVLRRRPQAGR